MEEPGDEPDRSEVPRALLPVHNPVRIEEYLQSSTWEERLLAARLQREAVMAERIRLAITNKARVQVLVDGEYEVESADGNPSKVKTVHKPLGWEARLQAAREQRKHLAAPKGSHGADLPPNSGRLPQERQRPLLLLSAHEATRSDPEELEDEYAQSGARVTEPPPVLSSMPLGVGSSGSSSIKNVFLVVLGLAVGLGVGFTMQSDWFNGPSGNARMSDATWAGYTPGILSPALRMDGALPLVMPSEGPPSFPKQWQIYDPAGAAPEGPPQSGRAPIERPRVAVRVPLAPHPAIGEVPPQQRTASEHDVPVGSTATSALLAPDTGTTQRDLGGMPSTDPKRVEVTTWKKGIGTSSGAFRPPDLHDVQQQLKVWLNAAFRTAAPMQKPMPPLRPHVRFASGNTYRVVLHLTRDQNAARIEAQLADLGLVNVEQVESDFRPAQTTVAYYHAADGLFAAMLASVFQGTAIDMTGLKPSRPAHSVELYLTD